ncbi:MAG: DNA polymerase III subunit beta [Candidatus Gastranaerophilales bacterium]|nr:DNA polymerase III subunit beta [Candidatus Gastranaerophilales bacterium]
MEIVLNKEDFSNGIKIVEKITSQKTIQPILSNILIEAISNDRVRFCAADANLNLAINYKTSAQIDTIGAITLSAKKLSEIVSKLSSTEVTLKSQEDTDNIKIKSGKTEFDMIGISASEFPKVLDDVDTPETKTFVLNKNEFSKAIKQVIFAVSQQETQAVLTGVCFNIENNILELAATDGNRLTRIQKEIDTTVEELINFIVPAKTLAEVQRISSIVEDENITIKIQKNKILFEFENLAFQSRLIDGIYPKYQQLIPNANEKKIVIDRAELINSIERVSVMVNDRTNIVKFNFSAGQLEIMADTPEAGRSKDYIDIQYDFDDMLTAFNYKYVLDGLKNMDSKNVEIEISDVLAASIFKPQEDKNNYICLIMPVKVQ